MILVPVQASNPRFDSGIKEVESLLMAHKARDPISWIAIERNISAILSYYGHPPTGIHRHAGRVNIDFGNHHTVSLHDPCS